MPSDQVLEFVLATEHLDAARAEVLGQFPTALIGTKTLDRTNSLLWITLYAVEPTAIARTIARLGRDIPEIQHRPTKAPTLSDLVARAKRAQTDPLDP